MIADENTPAKMAAIAEWDSWERAHPNEAKISGGIAFFTYLQRNRPDLLLDFKYPGDKWQLIYSWLLREGKVNR
jgi:hypothetical protein